MDSVVGKIINARLPEEKYQLEVYLDKSTEVIIRSMPALAGCLGALDPAKHTMGFVWIASIRSLVDDRPQDFTIPITELLIQRGDFSQLNGSSRAFEKWRILLHRYSEVMREFGAHRRGMSFLKKAMAIRDRGDSLTPAHSDFLMLALRDSNLHIALSILNRPVLDVNPKSTGSCATDYLSYFYYGGLVYIGLKLWADAKRFLDAVLTMPAHVPSAIMVEAYKAYLMVGVVWKGAFWSLPQNAPLALERTVRVLCADYADLASACESRDRIRISKLFDTGAFSKESLLGLVRQAVDNVVKHHILDLTKTYITLSLSQMASTVGTTKEDVLRLLLSMVDDEMIFATVDRVNEMVSFNDAPREQASALEEQITAARAVAERIKEVETQVELSFPYVAEKLRNHPQQKEILAEYETRKKANRSMTTAVTDFMFRAAGGGGAGF